MDLNCPLPSAASVRLVGRATTWAVTQARINDDKANILDAGLMIVVLLIYSWRKWKPDMCFAAQGCSWCSIFKWNCNKSSLAKKGDVLCLRQLIPSEK